MKVFYLGVEVRAILSIADVEKYADKYDLYVADGNLYIEERGSYGG